MPITIRDATSTDQSRTAEIIYGAFHELDQRHDVPAYMNSMEDANIVASHLYGIPKIRGFVAEDDGQVVGVGFIHDLGEVGMGISPLAVAPDAQARGAGQAILDRMIEHAGGASIRLLQDAFNNATLALYSRYGFVVREQVTCIQGKPPTPKSDLTITHDTDPAGTSEALHRAIMGFNRPAFPTRPVMAHRGAELAGFIAPGTEYPYAAADNEDTLMALIAGLAADLDSPITVAIPAAHSQTLRWMLDRDGRVIRSMNLMVRGAYQRPSGARLNSGSY
jgi:ribosomal protein S18 acetylase RimI-like enzyme